MSGWAMKAAPKSIPVPCPPSWCLRAGQQRHSYVGAYTAAAAQSMARRLKAIHQVENSQGEIQTQIQARPIYSFATF